MTCRLGLRLLLFVTGVALVGGLIATTADAQTPRKSISKVQAIELLENGVSPTRVEELIRAYGISFDVTPQVLTEFRDAGASEDLIRALREIGVKPEPRPPAEKSETPPASQPAVTAPAPAPPAPPIMVVEATPPGAEVYVDEERIGTTGPEGKLKISTLGPGTHRVRVSSAGFEDFSRSVELTAGQTMMVAVSLAAVKQAAAEPPAAAPSGSQQPVGIRMNPGGDNPMDIYKAMMGGMTGQSEPGLSRFYVTHEHGKGVLGYGGGMCYGWLIIGKGRVQFSSNDEDDAFEAAASEISDLRIKSNHIRFRFKNKNYHLMTQDMGMLGGESQGPGALRDAFDSVGLKAKD